MFGFFMVLEISSLPADVSDMLRASSPLSESLSFLTGLCLKAVAFRMGGPLYTEFLIIFAAGLIVMLFSGEVSVLKYFLGLLIP